jgi:hypothetical protein
MSDERLRFDDGVEGCVTGRITVIGKPNIGSDFDTFLEEESIKDEVTLAAILKTYLSVSKLLITMLGNVSASYDSSKSSDEDISLITDAACDSIVLADVLHTLLPSPSDCCDPLDGDEAIWNTLPTRKV